MAKFKQEQIIPGVTKTRTNAVKVYCSEAISAGDIISVVGMQGDFRSVAKADANGAVTLNNSLLFVADFAGASGEYLPLALPWNEPSLFNFHGLYFFLACHNFSAAENSNHPWSISFCDHTCSCKGRWASFLSMTMFMHRTRLPRYFFVMHLR